MTERVNRDGIHIAAELLNFVEAEALPGTGLDPARFWSGVARILTDLAPQNRELLNTRDRIQQQIDLWHVEHKGKPVDADAYQGFLHDIGYLVAEPEPFSIATRGVDPEIATMAGPQLVVPALNDRFVLNAANARWGSLYDALYGTDALDAAPAKSGGYDANRGAAVIARARECLDAAIPGWIAVLDGGAHDAHVATAERSDHAKSFLFRHHGLHIEIIVDPTHPVGRTDPLGIADVSLESALTAIIDLEDSVAAVDAADKVAAYRNWLGLMRGDLVASFEKGGKTVSRALEPDRFWGDYSCPGRSLMFVRNVGHLMTSSAILMADGCEAPEGILDAIFTSLCGLHDIKGLGRFKNSRAGSIYIVKPKMHGPAEAAFTDRLFDAVEDLLGIARHTIKVGVMDEERRTSANLAACIHAVKNRIVFINTGFLDRTGDEIHTSMHAGPMIRKAEMKGSAWISAYEARNVAIGLACGFSGRAQIGKGMWAAPDMMSAMLEQKIAHPQSGANTAWVPSPTAATLHALHYHQVDVFARQAELAQMPVPGLAQLLTIPTAPPGHNWSADEVREELENNAQGILGYVVRWIDQGIGCSKVPDIHDVGLMEDRATLRISSQHMANWLVHGVCSSDDVDAAFTKMALKVDAQNADDPLYQQLTPERTAFQAARALVYEGVAQPNGYTEPLLHKFRIAAKSS